jgi:hypothetical protein
VSDTYYLAEQRQGRWSGRPATEKGREDYDHFFGQENPYEAIDELALLDVRIAMLLERSEPTAAGIPPASWPQLRKMVDKVVDAFDLNDERALGRYLRSLSREVDRGYIEQSVWAEIAELIQMRQGIARNVRREDIERQKMMSIAEANNYISNAARALVTAATSVLESQDDKEKVAEAALAKFTELQNAQD